MKYKVTYARVIVMTTIVDAANEGETYLKAAALDIQGALGPQTVIAKDGSEIAKIVDYDAIWNAKPVNDDGPDKD